MKTALEIISGLISSLTAIFTSKKQHTCSSKETPPSEPQAPEQEKQQPEPEIKSVAEIEVPETKPAAAEVEVNAEPTVVNSQITDTTVVSPPASEPVKQPVETFAKPQVKEPASSIEESSISEFPQDSILKRHYFNHILTMVEALASQRPSDSVLCRHYYMMLTTTIDQCLHDKKAMEKLIYDYEHLSS